MNSHQELVSCILKISRLMNSDSYFYYDKENNEIILNDKVYTIEDNQMYQTDFLKPIDVFENSGFATTVK